MKADDDYFIFLDSGLRIRKDRSQEDCSFVNNLSYQIPEQVGYAQKYHYDKTNYEVHFAGGNSSQFRAEALEVWAVR